ncbi:MAG: LuxR C-terminal-related transcriptional regulator [Bermanella sp.]|jgi:Response regulator containing a CheY-like receiver domain and an HTH DNA-binding domain
MTQGLWKVHGTFPQAQGEVLLGLANGLTNKEIARERGVSVYTVNAQIMQLRAKISARYEAVGKRAKIVSEAIHRGWLVPLMVLLCMYSVMSAALNPDLQLRRPSNRLTARTMANRVVRGKRSREALAVDLELSDTTPESLLAFFESTPIEPRTLAPWSGPAWIQHNVLSNPEREHMWRAGYETLLAA